MSIFARRKPVSSNRKELKELLPPAYARISECRTIDDFDALMNTVPGMDQGNHGNDPNSPSNTGWQRLMDEQYGNELKEIMAIDSDGEREKKLADFKQQQKVETVAVLKIVSDAFYKMLPHFNKYKVDVMNLIAADEGKPYDGYPTWMSIKAHLPVYPSGDRSTGPYKTGLGEDESARQAKFIVHDEKMGRIGSAMGSLYAGMCWLEGVIENGTVSVITHKKEIKLDQEL